MAWRWKISNNFLPSQSHDVQSYTTPFVCWTEGLARAASSGWQNLLLPHFNKHFASSSLQVPSTLCALQTSTRQHSLGFSHYSSAEYNKISSGMMLHSMIFSAWLVFESGSLGIQLSQYTSTNPAMLVFGFATSWCFVPPDSRSHLTLEGTQAFLLADVWDRSGWKETCCFPCTDSILNSLPYHSTGDSHPKVGNRWWTWMVDTLQGGDVLASLLMEPNTILLALTSMSQSRRFGSLTFWIWLVWRSSDREPRGFGQDQTMSAYIPVFPCFLST